jgi:hypothetical protein
MDGRFKELERVLLQMSPTIDLGREIKDELDIFRFFHRALRVKRTNELVDWLTSIEQSSPIKP